MQQMNHESSNYKWLQFLDDGGVEETQMIFLS